MKWWHPGMLGAGFATHAPIARAGVGECQDVQIDVHSAVHPQALNEVRPITTVSPAGKLRHAMPRLALWHGQWQFPKLLALGLFCASLCPE